MGIIRHAEKAPTNILYKVDDMTAAPMDVRQWVDTDVSTGFGTEAAMWKALRIYGENSFPNKQKEIAV